MPRIPIIHQLIASGFGSGYSPIAPGTAGAFLAMLIWWAYATLLNDSHLVFLCTLSLVIIFTVLGTWSASVAENTGEKILRRWLLTKWWEHGLHYWL